MTEREKEVFVKRVKEMRVAKRKTQENVGAYLGMGRTSVANWESGKNFPFTETLFKVAEYLETSMDYLVGKTHDPSPNAKLGNTGIAIENLVDLALTYQGKELTKHQKEKLVDLCQSALEIGGSNK